MFESLEALSLAHPGVLRYHLRSRGRWSRRGTLCPSTAAGAQRTPRAVEDISPWPIHRGPGPAHERRRPSSASVSPIAATPSCSRGAPPPRRRSRTRLLAAEGGDVEATRKAVAEAAAALDRAAKVGAIHPNNAARRKSRLMRRANAALGGEIADRDPQAAAPGQQGRRRQGRQGPYRGQQGLQGQGRADGCRQGPRRAQQVCAQQRHQEDRPPSRRRPRRRRPSRPRPRPRRRRRRPRSRPRPRPSRRPRRRPPRRPPPRRRPRRSRAPPLPVLNSPEAAARAIETAAFLCPERPKPSAVSDGGQGPRARADAWPETPTRRRRSRSAISSARSGGGGAYSAPAGRGRARRRAS